jgi:fatty-acyl-CoA synthase
VTLLERAAATFPDQGAVLHGSIRRSYGEFYARCKLASALTRRRRGDTDG